MYVRHAVANNAGHCCGLVSVSFMLHYIFYCLAKLELVRHATRENISTRISCDDKMAVRLIKSSFILDMDHKRFIENCSGSTLWHGQIWTSHSDVLLSIFIWVPR